MILLAHIDDFSHQPSREVGEAELLEFAFFVQRVHGFEGFSERNAMIRRVQIKDFDAVYAKALQGGGQLRADGGLA